MLLSWSVPSKKLSLLDDALLMEHPNIPAFLNNVVWEALPEQEPGDLPYATHSGVLELFGHKLRCYRLSDGRAIFEQNDFIQFLDAWFGGELEK